jgi:two-component system LytT family response regulator
MLRERGDVEVVAEVGDGRAAIAAIEQHHPDLVLLDVQMPEIDGFGVVEAIGSDRMPPVVFVTAFDHYAIRAFDVHAFDYLLKPFDQERLDRALDRVLAARRLAPASELAERLTALLGDVAKGHANEPLARIPVRTERGFYFVNVDDIDWIEADGKVLRIHAGTEIHSLRLPLTTLAARLAPSRFARVHRSTIVNIAHIVELQTWFQGDYVLILRDGTRVTTGRRYRETVQRLLDLRGTS